VHERWGLATAIAFLAWAAASSWKPLRRSRWLLGLAAAALVAVTAYLGGVVAHGE
jgi:hypothetical protein